jgi:hypothetical protein
MLQPSILAPNADEVLHGDHITMCDCLHSAGYEGLSGGQHRVTNTW